MLQHNYTSHGHSPLNHLRPSMKRVALETLATQHPTFTLIATMTEPAKSAMSWHGETGYIDQSLIQRYVDDRESPIYYIAGLPEMVSAMKTVLTDSGVSENNIRAEEFPGFDMDHHDVANSKTRRMRPLLPIAIVLMIIVAASLHVVGGMVFLKTGFGAFSLHNPLSDVLLGLFLVFAMFKLKHVLGFMQRRQK